MSTAWLSVVGTLLCTLLVASEVVPQDNFNLQAVAGKWYLIGFATNAQWPDSSCWRMNHLAKKTDVPGKFTFKTERMDNDNDMRVVDVKYDEYALIYNLKMKGGVPTVLNKLYGRASQLNPQMLERFRQFSLESGILPENIAILPQNGECPDA
ncbi:hypothetical protein CRUP_028676 [Coryphaenoides rupestris]|nr:hypothetical protein CRUP_028676 [Coryphaenoides rupestris]